MSHANVTPNMEGVTMAFASFYEFMDLIMARFTLLLNQH
jgi:hypothetical protein